LATRLRAVVPKASAKGAPRRWYASCFTVSIGTGARGVLEIGPREEDETMLWTLAVVFLVLWGLGFVAFHVTSGFIHLLLVIAVIAVIFQLVSGRRTV
jgi:hypothetical protein